MKLHKEGIRTFIVTFILMALFILLGFSLTQQLWIRILIVGVSVVLFGFVLYFFRHPWRDIVIDENAIYSAADGTVVVIEQTEESEYFKEKRMQISVFMSPMNMHVNYSPIQGIVRYMKYHPGRYLVASRPKASTDNERTSIVLEKEKGKEVMVRQIAGTVARRIVCRLKENDVLEQGQEIGMIKFGSRVDIFLPLSVKLNVQLGDSVRAKKTVLAYFE